MPPLNGVDHNQNDFFWGAVTSSVDWCEKNYGITFYIAEFFNTFSSFAMIIVGILGIFFHKKFLEKRFLFAFFFTIIVGIGSTLFHCMLKYEMQMLDELPMLYVAFTFVFIVLERNSQHGKPSYPWLPMGLLAHATFTTALVASTSGSLQFWLFHISFGSAEFYSIGKICMQFWYVPLERDTGFLFRIGLRVYGCAIVCWLLDLQFCDYLENLPLGIPNPQLHAWWHALVSIGLYMLTILGAYDRMAFLRHKPQIQWMWGILPYVHDSAIQKTKENKKNKKNQQ